MSSGEADEEYLGIDSRLFSAREDALRLPSLREELLPPSPGNSDLVQQLVMCVCAALCFRTQILGSQCDLCSWLLRNLRHFLECVCCAPLSLAGVGCMQCRLAVSAIDMHVRRCCCSPGLVAGDCVLCDGLRESELITVMNGESRLALNDWDHIRCGLRRVMQTQIVLPPLPPVDDQPRSLPVAFRRQQSTANNSLPNLLNQAGAENSHGGARPKTYAAPRVPDAGASFLPPVRGPPLSRQHSRTGRQPSEGADSRAFHNDPGNSTVSDQANTNRDAGSEAVTHSLQSMRFSAADNVLPLGCVVLESGSVFYGQLEDVETFLCDIEGQRDRVWREDDTTEGIIYRQYQQVGAFMDR